MAYIKQKIVLEKIKSFVDLEYLLNSLGFQITSKNDQEFRCKCKIHGGSNPTSFAMNRVLKNWICFSNGCEEEFGRDVVGLVRSTTRCSFTEALEKLSYMTGISLDEEINEKAYNKFIAETEKTHLINENKTTHTGKNVMKLDTKNLKGKLRTVRLESPLEIDDIIMTHIKLPVLPRGGYKKISYTEAEINTPGYYWFTNEDGVERKLALERGDCIKLEKYDGEELLSNLANGRDYFINRGFSQKILDRFSIGGAYFDYRGVKRVVIPVHDADGNLVGHHGRRLDESDDEKYRTEKFEKGSILYNLNNAKNYVGDSSTLILVEGVTDVWALWNLGYYNTVSSLGCKITKEQASLIIKYVLNLIIIFDGDKEGMKSADRVENILGKTMSIYRIILPEGKDPCSVDPAWLDTRLRNIYKELI